MQAPAKESSRPGLAAVAAYVARSGLDLTLIDRDGQILEVSPQMMAASGLARERLVGRNAAKLFGVAPEILGAWLTSGEHVQLPAQELIGPNGMAHWTQCSLSPWFYEDGSLGGVIAVSQNITAEKRALDDVQRVEAVLEAIVESMPSMLSVQEIDTGDILRINRATEAFIGLSRDQLLYRGRPKFVGDKVREDSLALIAAAVAADGEIVESEQDVPRCDGQLRRLLVRRRLMADRSGKRHVLTIGDDITERKRTEAAMQTAAAEAEAANRAKSDFLANMSHEIRTPLNGVMGVAGALARTELTAPQQEMVSLIEASAKTLETLLSDILDLARIEAGKMEIRPERFDLAASVNACSALFDAAAQAKGLDLKVEIAPAALGAYIGDAARIRQILSNLLSNAVKFTTLGGVTMTVAARRGETSSELRFEVRDTGIGFDAEIKARLFSRFEQADGSITRRFGGSGLGLSISRSLAEAMGGRLEADTTPGEGAVFTLTLELPHCEVAPDPQLEAAKPEAAADPLVGLRVLLAEDHPTNRRVVELILGAAGVELTCVENGVEAVDAFRRQAFDLILMDMQMPLMDGLTAIGEIRRIERATGQPPTPIHVLTANAMPEHINGSIAAGADGHLSKPIRAEALLACVATGAATARQDRSLQA